MRTLTTLLLLLAILLGAARMEGDYAARQWPYGWVAYCVDTVIGPRPGMESKPYAGTAPLTAAEDLSTRLNELDRRLKTARELTADDWQMRAEAARELYRKQTLWSRLGLSWWWPVPESIEPTPMSSLQTSRVVDRILEPLETAVRSQIEWLATSPAESEIRLRLEGKRTLRISATETRLGRDRNGVVLTVAEMNRKALQAPHAPLVLGRGVTVIGLGLLLAWAFLSVFRRPTGWLVLLAPALLGGALLMSAISLGALPLRTVGVRHLDSLHDLVWWPLVATLVGVAVALLARWDGWLAPRLLAFRDAPGLLRRAVLLLIAAALVPLVFGASAVRSEIWLGLALLSLGLFAARNATAMAVTQEPTAFGWPLVVGVGSFVVFMAAIKSDWGTAVLAAGLMTAWYIQFARVRWVLACMAVGVAAIAWWGGQLHHENATQLRVSERAVFLEGEGHCDAEWVKHPRFIAACSVLVSERSDVARSLWLARAGIQQDWMGFGLVDLPINGMGASREADRVITQLPADYIAAPAVAAFGWMALIGLWCYGMILVSLGARTVATLRLPERSGCQHLLAAVAGFGLIAVALRTWTTIGGALSGIPLTGTPAPAISFGTSAAVAAGFYLGIALASQPARIRRA